MLSYCVLENRNIMNPLILRRQLIIKPYGREKDPHFQIKVIRLNPTFLKNKDILSEE